jgi:glycosyltransferase involved in cell wall biosynthesis
VISFFTWCFNRLPQLRQVLPVNLDRADLLTQFVLLDPGSTDGLAEYAAGITDPRFRYVYSPQPQIHFARLYNLAASYCLGRYLVCLDADNAIGPDFCRAVRKHCTAGSFLHAWDHAWASGTYGRVAMLAETFRALGGYDESLGPCGAQDSDLIARAKASGLLLHVTKDPAIVGHAIANTKAEKVAALQLTAADYARINAANHRQSRAAVAAGRLIANQEPRT